MSESAKHINVSVVIVNYKTPDLVNKCIDSIKHYSTGFNYEIIVVDNDSHDNSRQQVTNKHVDITWIDAGYNSGFARGNNMGLRQATGQFALLINSDTRLEQNSIGYLLNFYQKNERQLNLGLVGCRLISEERELLIGSHADFPSLMKVFNANPLVIRLNRLLKYDPDIKKTKNIQSARKTHYTNHKVSVVSGACVFFNREKLHLENLYLDEDFFLYSEDTEWSYRVHKAGYTNYFYGETEIVHFNSATTSKEKSKNKQIQLSEFFYFYKTCSRFLFTLYVLCLRFNFVLNHFLLKRNNELEKLQNNDLERSFFNSSLRKIKTDYRRTPSSSKNYLKYVE